MKNRKTLHILSVLLVVALMCSLIPSAYAAGGDRSGQCCCGGCAGQMGSGRKSSDELRDEAFEEYLDCLMDLNAARDPAERQRLLKQAEELWGVYSELLRDGVQAQKPAKPETQHSGRREHGNHHGGGSGYMTHDYPIYGMYGYPEFDMDDYPMYGMYGYPEFDMDEYPMYGMYGYPEFDMDEYPMYGMYDYPEFDMDDYPMYDMYEHPEFEMEWLPMFDSDEQPELGENELPEINLAELPTPDTNELPPIELDQDQTPGENELPMIGLPNPWTTTDAAEEAVKISGAAFTELPETALPKGMELFHYRAMAGTLEADYSNGTDELMLRVSTNKSGFALAGDYNTYSKKWTEKIGDLEIECLGDGERVNVAVFSSGDLSYSIGMANGKEGAGLTVDELGALARALTAPAAKEAPETETTPAAQDAPAAENAAAASSASNANDRRPPVEISGKPA